MLKGLVFCTDNKLLAEISNITSKLPNVDVESISDIKKIPRKLQEKSVLFVIISMKITDEFLSINKFFTEFPQVYFIYYFPSLNIDNFQYTDFTGFSHLIVGEKRKSYFSEILTKLTKDYWKKIPYKKVGISYEGLSQRMKKVMSYIETHGLKQCSAAKISQSLEISQGYLSQEFKRETGLTFRTFMQKLLDHYEFVI